MRHEPDPTYLDHLEWQLRTALRRRSSFAAPTRTGAQGAVRTLLLAAVCLVGGAGVVLASERLQDVREREAQVARARVVLEMAELDLEGARESLARTTDLRDRGLVSVQDVAHGERALAAKETEVGRRRLDLEETELSGDAPHDDLGAPRIAGRDFVGERLELAVRDAERALAPLREAQVRAERMAESGFVDARETADAARAVAEGERAARLLRDRSALRRELLRGALDPREVAVRERVLELDADLERARDALSAATAEAERARTLAEVGHVTERESRERELERRHCESRVELLELERGRWLERAGR